MIENNNPEIDVEELMGKIRAEIAGRKANQQAAGLPSPAAVSSFTSSPDLLKLQSLLRAAEDGADITNLESPMIRFPKSLRWLAKGMMRVVNYLARIITVRQTEFNQAVLQALQQAIVSFREQNEQAVLSFREQNEQMEIKAAQLTAEFALIQRQFAELLEDGRQQISGGLDEVKQVEKFSKQEMHLLDAMYANFEDQFRGSREDIKDRLKVYLPIVKENNFGTPDNPILDLGCGRGEWLEILKAENFSARGIDLNILLIERCREMQLDVIDSDIFEYLPSLPDASIGVVTAFHLVEHLLLGDAIKLMDAAMRVLKPGGVIILETPNPENMLVGSCNFYYDPTHRNPIPPKLLKFQLESRGFCRVEIIPLHPYDENAKISGDNSEIASRFNKYLYGPQDYAVIGYKA